MSTITRIRSIDFLRGLVMIIMALDHSRDLIYRGAFTSDPLDLQTTTGILFFTRWITHFCAPTFAFLSGVSIYLQSLRKPRRQLSGFLLTRGLWLIFVELAIVTLAITFNIFYGTLIFQVIWAIGASMVVMAALVWLPYRAILVIGLVIMLGHNALDSLEGPRAALSVWYSVLHRPTILPVQGGPTFAILYPLLPWIGIIALGYAFGRIYTLEPAARKKIMLWAGLGCIALYIVLRLPNLYGDPLHWSKQPTLFFSVLSFINTQKYPPSLLYFLMTIGPAILVLRAAEGWSSKFTRVVTVYGSVPFFYYILHFYMIHIVSAVLFLSRGHSVEEGMRSQPGFFPFRFMLSNEGYSLAVVYLVWIGVVLALYPLCKWFRNYKKSHDYAWLSYL